MPRIGIITALLSGDRNIHETAASLLPQLNKDVVWMIKYSEEDVPKDLRVLEENPFVEVIGEKDSSLYMGLNQAVRRTAADFVMVIGAGDTLVPGALKLVTDSLAAYPVLDSFFFAVRIPSGGGLLPRPSELGVRMACPHPGAVLRTEKIRLIGGFDERYQVAADYDLISRFVSQFPGCGWGDQVVVNYAGGGLSEKRAVEGYLEEELVRIRVWKSPLEAVCARGNRVFGGGRA